MRKQIIVVLMLGMIATMTPSFASTSIEGYKPNIDSAASILEKGVEVMNKQIEVVNKMKVGTKLVLKDNAGKVLQEITVTEQYKKERLDLLLHAKLTEKVIDLLLSPPDLCGGVSIGACQWAYVGYPCGVFCCCQYWDEVYNQEMEVCFCNG